MTREMTGAEWRSFLLEKARTGKLPRCAPLGRLLLDDRGRRDLLKAPRGSLP
jgi:hypothetical protein